MQLLNERILVKIFAQTNGLTNSHNETKIECEKKTPGHSRFEMNAEQELVLCKKRRAMSNEKWKIEIEKKGQKAIINALWT